MRDPFGCLDVRWVRFAHTECLSDFVFRYAGQRRQDEIHISIAGDARSRRFPGIRLPTRNDLRVACFAHLEKSLWSSLILTPQSEQTCSRRGWFTEGTSLPFASRLLRCVRRVASFPEVHRLALRTLAFLKVLPATTTPTRLLSALSRSHIGPGARWGSISNQAPSQPRRGLAVWVLPSV